jgi:hypothetical protein
MKELREGGGEREERERAHDIEKGGIGGYGKGKGRVNLYEIQLGGRIVQIWLRSPDHYIVHMACLFIVPLLLTIDA